VDIFLSKTRSGIGNPEEPDFRLEAGQPFKLTHDDLKEKVEEKKLNSKSFWMRLKVFDRCGNFQDDNEAWELTLVP
jgi:hypothetical protein